MKDIIDAEDGEDAQKPDKDSQPLVSVSGDHEYLIDKNNEYDDEYSFIRVLVSPDHRKRTANLNERRDEKYQRIALERLPSSARELSSIFKIQNPTVFSGGKKIYAYMHVYYVFRHKRTVCMYVFMYVFMYVCILIRISVCYVCMYVCMLCMYVCILQ